MKTVTSVCKTILLARVSDDKQTSEEAQLNNIRAFAERYGLTNFDERKIKESSTKADRKKFQEIIAEIKVSKAPIAVVVDTVDRLQRSFRESVVLEDFRKAGKVELYFQRDNLVIKKDSNSSDLMRWDMGVMFARNYVLQLGDNVRRKFKQMREEGKKTSRVDIGYVAVHEIDAKGKKQRIDIKPDPEKAPLIVQAFHLFASELYSIETITSEMQKRGLTGRKGKPICRSMMFYILTNPFFYGMMRTKGEVVPHIYEPLIGKQLFDKVQTILNKRRKNPTKFASKDFALQGIVYCEHPDCGCLYSPEMKKERLIYYSCTNAKKVHPKREYIREEKLLEPIYEALGKLQLPKEKGEELVKALKKNIESTGLYRKKQKARLRDVIDEEREVMKGVAIKFGRNEIDKGIYDEVVTASKEKQRQAEISLANLTDTDEDYFIDVGRVIDIARRAKDIFQVNEKKQFLRFLLQNASADGKKLTFTMKSPFNELISISERLIELGTIESVRTYFMTQILVS